MDLSSYSGLKSAIADFLNRDDLVTQIPGFIALAEAEIRRRVRRKTLRSTVTFTTDSYPVPADCAELRSLRLVTSDPSSDKPLVQLTAPTLDERRASNGGASGRPRFWAVVGANILFERAPSQATNAELRYFEKLTALSSSVTSNSVLADSPDLYLYGALKHAAPYLQHDERIPVWKQFFEDGVVALDAQRQNEEHSGAPQTARLPFTI